LFLLQAQKSFSVLGQSLFVKQDKFRLANFHCFFGTEELFADAKLIEKRVA